MVRLIPLILLTFFLALPAMAEDLRPLTFKDKHPKVYKAYRVSRSACVKAEPFLKCLSYVANCFTPFVVR